eukprot:s1219_g12.t1
MSISVDVHLLSGKRASVEVEADALVELLKQKAQSALVAGRGRLLNSSGEVLDGAKTITEANLKSGDVLTLHVSQVQFKATRQGGMFPGLAFAALLGDRSVVAWGAPDFGGDCSSVQGLLKNVQQIQASGRAFAAILADGSVVSWGHADFGGDSSAVQAQLTNVQQIQASVGAFAAIRGDGFVVTWGSHHYGGDSSWLRHELLEDVQQIQASSRAFAAILGDGSVVTWGNGDYGGDCSWVQDQLQDVRQIRASEYAFAAILGDGSAVTWGTDDCGGDSSWVQEELQDVRQIQASSRAFAAILGDGSVVAWGHADFGGDCSWVQDQLRDVKQIQASLGAFAAIRGDGSVVTWGNADFGGDSRAVQEQLKTVRLIQASSRAFAAILGDGSVVTWGTADYGGDCSRVQDQLRDVQQIQASSRAFAAILGDGSVATANETFTELGFFSAKETVDKKRTVGALLAVFWIVASQYDQFVRGQAEGVRLSKSSWDHLQDTADWTRNTVCLTKSHSMVSAMLVYVAIMNVGKIKPFRAAFAPEEDEPAEALARILHRSPMLVPSFAKLEPEQQHVILSALKADFNFGQFLQAENLPASLFTVRQILAEGGAASGDILGFFLFSQGP